MNMKYVSIDIETTGLDPNRCQVLEVGAVIDDGTTHIECCPTFHCYVEHDWIYGEPYAMSMHPKILRRIATHEAGYTYRRPKEVALAFWHFLDDRGLCPHDGTTVVAGKNYANFDARFLRRMEDWDADIKFGHRILDPALLYWRPKEDGMTLPGLQTCMRRAGIEGKVTHTAVEDARMVVMLMRHATGHASRCRPING